MSMSADKFNPTLHDLPLSDRRCNNDSCFAFEVAHNLSQATVSYNLQFEYGHWLAWYYAIIIFIFTIIYLSTYWPSTTRKYDDEKPTLWQRTKACWRFVGYRRFSGALGDRLGLPSIGMLLFLLAGVLVMFIMTIAIRPYYRGHRGYGSPPLAIRTGLMATSLTPLLIALSGKFNLVTVLTGIGYERLNVIHRWVGWAIFGLSVAHTIPFIVAPLRDGGYAALHEAYYEPGAFEYTGTPPLAILFGIVVCSLPFVRHRLYESFYWSHVLLAVTYLGLCFWHFGNLGDSWTYLWASIGLWLLSMLARMFYKNQSFLVTRSWPTPFPTRISSLPGYVTRVDVTVPRDVVWSPGQHCYLRLPDLMSFQNHPFTIASSCNDDFEEKHSYRTMTFFVRGYKGFTGKLLTLADEKGVLTTSSWLEGPYGTNVRSIERRFDKAVVVVGGSGITSCLAWLSYLTERISTGNARLTSVEVIWMVRKKEHVQWVHDELHKAKLAAADAVTIHFFVTQEGGNKGVKSAVEREKAMYPHREDIDSCVAERPYVPKLLPEMLGKGRNLVISCGPQSLMTDIANACAGAQKRVLQSDMVEVALHTETFGWG